MTVFVLLIAVTQAAYAVTRAIPFVPEGYDPSLVGAWAGALMLLVLFFLLVRTATLYDRALRKQYADVGEGRPLRFLLCSVRFWAETAAFALLFLLLLVAGFFAMLLPQLFTSLMNLANAIPGYFRDAETTLLKWLEDDPQLRTFVETQLTKVYQGLTGMLNPETLNKVWDMLSGLTSSVLSVVGVFVDFLLGLVASVYILWSRPKFLAQAKAAGLDLIDLDELPQL